MSVTAGSHYDLMLRKRIEFLSARNGRLFFGNESYSGVGYEPRSGRSVNAVMVEQGRIVSEYRSPYFASPEHPAQIDISGFTENRLIGDEAAALTKGDVAYDLSQGYYDLVFQGTPYSGLAYEFRGENCVSEFGYANGRLVSKVSWDSKGELRGLYLTGETEQNYKWYPSGALELAELYRVVHVNRVAQHAYRGRFVFAESGALAAMAVDKPFVVSLDKISGNLSAHWPVRSVDDFGKLRGADVLWLFGDGIDDEIFEKMDAAGVFKDTTEVALSNTSLRGTGIDIESLARNPNLKRVRLESNRDLQSEFVDALKSRGLDIVQR